MRGYARRARSAPRMAARPKAFDTASTELAAQSGVPASLSRVPAMQAKYRVGPANDHFESEADRTADRIVSGPAGRAPAKVTPLSFSPGTTQSLQPDQQAGASATSAGADRAAAALQSGGRAMTSSERHYFEPRFGADLSGVRIHEGSDVDDAAGSISARAYTVGSDIAFASGEYSETTASGRRLMAHELAHTLQQGMGAGEEAVRRQSLPDPEELWERAKRFGGRQIERGRRYYDRGSDYAERATERAGEALEGASEDAGAWWNRGGGDISRIDFDGSQVTVSGAVSKTYRAVSGLMANAPQAGGVDYTGPEFQDLADKGPIPEGDYYLDPAEVESNPPGRFNVSAWGRYRTRLHETIGTGLMRHATTSRSGGFYLHQDANHNGTAGCIGLWNATDNREIHRLIKANSEQIPVHVDYPEPVTESAGEGAATQQVQRSLAPMASNELSLAGIPPRPLARSSGNRMVVQRDGESWPEQHYLITEGIARIDRDEQRFGRGAFPSDYYDTLARHLFRIALRHKGRDYGDAFSLLNSLQWNELGRGLQDHYTDVVGTDSANGWDKFRHFVFTAYLQYKSYGLLAPEGFTYGKEIYDEVEGFFGADPEGYSVADIRADNRGERFAEEMAAQENEEMWDAAGRAVERGLSALIDPRTYGVGF